MKVLVLEATRMDDVNQATIASYTRVAREHGDVELSILTRPGIAKLPNLQALPPEVRLLEEVPDYYSRGNLEHRLISLLESETFDILFAPREGDIIRAARLRERYGIPGQGVASALAYRDKLVMKKVLATAGVRVWPSTEVVDAVDFWFGVERIGYPCVLKPRLEFGAENIFFIRNERDAKRAVVECFSRVPVDVPAHYVLEAFTELAMCHVDGVWHEGEPYYSLVSEYFGFADGKPLKEHAGAACGSKMIDPLSDRGRHIAAFVHDAIRALPSSHTFTFHAEVWEDADGGLYMNEIASRTGGNLVRTNAIASTGVEPDAVWLALLTGVDPLDIGFVGQAKLKPCAGVGLPYRSGLVVSVEESGCPSCVIDLRLRPEVRPGSVLPLQSHWSDTLGVATVVTESHNSLNAEVDRVVEWARNAVVIDPAGCFRGLGGGRCCW